MGNYLLALDQGTSSSRAIVFDKTGNIVSLVQQEIQRFFPQNGWVEEDAEEIWQSQLAVAKAALTQSGLTHQDIAAIGITNQRETTILWDKATGKPVAPAIVWMCRRSAEICDYIIRAGGEGVLKAKTGLKVDPYFSASKIAWLFEHDPGLHERAAAGEVLFGTVDSWLLYNLTQGKVHATDDTNASRTLLYNIHEGKFDWELLHFFNVPAAMLPEVKPSISYFGETTLFGGSIPITGIAGDQQAALFGQGCFEAGSAKNTFGTGCFLLMHTGEKPVVSEHGLFTTIAAHGGKHIQYALEGSIFHGGSAVKWLRDGLGLIQVPAETESAAFAVPDNGGVYLVPAFSGLNAPYWDATARGVICGLNQGSNRNHIIRATLESIAYQVYDVLEVMVQEAGFPIDALRADGGAAANNFLMQFQADILQKPVLRPAMVEATAWGAASLAGLGVGFYRDEQELAALKRDHTLFTPKLNNAVRESLLRHWQRAMDKSRGWAK